MKLALAGDTMLGRGVAEAIRSTGPTGLFSEEVKEIVREADLFILNLECCISDRGEPWPDPTKPFFFRAPPAAVETLVDLGVACVTLANNHALDYGEVALLDTLDLLDEAGIAVIGAGGDVTDARQPATLTHDGFRLGVVGVSDHPAEFAAAEGPGIAYADLWSGVPDWLLDPVVELRQSTDGVLVTPHWGPNMTTEPPPHVQTAAQALEGVGATLVAGHSAHVFHGVARSSIFDMGDFVDDYAVDSRLRNDLGLLFLVELEPSGLVRLEAQPLALDYCYTRLADPEEAAWVARRFGAACAAFGTETSLRNGRLVIEFA